MTHVGEENRLCLAGLLGRPQRYAERVLGVDLLAGLCVDIGKTGAHTVYQMVFPVLRMADTGKTDQLIRLFSIYIDHIAVRDDPVFLQPFPDGIRLDKAHKFLPVFRHHVLITVCSNRFNVRELISCTEPVHIGTRLIADPFVFIQFQIIDAAEIGRKCGDHPRLLFLIRLLFQKFFLQGQPLFHLLMFDAVFCLGSLLFKPELCIPPVLDEDVGENSNQHKRCQPGLDQAASYDAVRYGADPVADDTFPDQVGEHPVRPFHGNITERFLDPVIGKRYDIRIAFPEIADHRLSGIPRFILCLFQGFQQVVFHRKSAEHRVAQGNAAGCVDVAESRSRILGFHGDPLQHNIHVDLHKTHIKPFAVNKESLIPDRDSDDHFLVRSLNVFDGDLRIRDGLRIK